MKKIAGVFLTALLAATSLSVIHSVPAQAQAGCSVFKLSEHQFGSSCLKTVRKNVHYAKARLYFDSGYSAFRYSPRAAMGDDSISGYYRDGRITEGPWLIIE